MESQTKRLFLRYLYYPLIDIFFPPVCWLCDSILSPDRKVVCSNCFNLMEKFHDETDEFNNEKFLFNNLIILYEFADSIRTLIHFIKYQDCRSIAKYFAEAAKNYLTEVMQTQYTLIIPVPLHPQRLRERGYNQSEEIAMHLSNMMGIEIIANPLIRNRPTQTQTKYNKQDRIKNMQGAFTCNTDLYGQTVLLIDDVITTGSTVNECCVALLEANVVLVDVLALANPRLE